MKVKQFGVILPTDCENCTYKVKHQRMFGSTYHCVPEASSMDVTHVNKGERSPFCPIKRLFDFITN